MKLTAVGSIRYQYSETLAGIAFQCNDSFFVFVFFGLFSQFVLLMNFNRDDIYFMKYRKNPPQFFRNLLPVV